MSIKKIINAIQSPSTDFGKSVRDAVIAGVAGGAVFFLQEINGVDFGDYELLVSTIVALVVAKINRNTREQ